MSMIGAPLVRTVRASALEGPVLVPVEEAAPSVDAQVEVPAGGAR
jgi:hypothetical protein